VCLNTYISNVRSTVNKLAEFRLFVDTYRHSPDMMCLSETWLMPDIPNSLIISQNVCKCFRKDRFSRGGGVAIFIKKITTHFCLLG